MPSSRPAALSAPLAAVVGSSAFAVGGWQKEDGGESVALDVPYMAFMARQDFYWLAFESAMGAALNTSASSVLVTSSAASSAGTTQLFFSVLLNGVDSPPLSSAPLRWHLWF